MVELKCALRWDYRKNEVSKEIEYMIIKTISAFLNYNGGNLYIGVYDDGKICGIQKDYESLGKCNEDGFMLHLYNLIESYIGKEYVKYVHTHFERLENETICKIAIEQSRYPVFVKHNGSKEFYVRLGNSSKLLDVEETTRYIQSHFEL